MHVMKPHPPRGWSHKATDLVENLPNAVLLAYLDAGHGSLFQYHEAFARLAAAFLSSTSESAVF